MIDDSEQDDCVGNGTPPTSMAESSRGAIAALAGDDSDASSSLQAIPMLTTSSMDAILQRFNRQVAMTLLGPQHMLPMQQSGQKPQAPGVQQVPKQIPTTPRTPTTFHSGGKRRREEAPAADEEDDDKSSHVLMPNLGGSRILCRLCSKRGLKTRSRYGCVQCRLGFHVECFAVFHHPSRFAASPSETVQDALDVMRGKSTSMPATRRRENHSIMSFEELTLPSASDIPET